MEIFLRKQTSILTLCRGHVRDFAMALHEIDQDFAEEVARIRWQQEGHFEDYQSGRDIAARSVLKSHIQSTSELFNDLPSTCISNGTQV
jgi:predicted heme/steroid binding protein